MKKLFLSSKFSCVAEKLPWGLLDHANELRVGFVMTAANPYSDAWWIEEDKKKLKKLGFIVRDIDIEGMDKEALYNVLRNIDILFVGGGNTFFLLYHARKSGFDTIVKEFVDSGNVYIGSSAGSVIMGPTLDVVRDPNDASMVPELTSNEAFHCIDTIILPHTGDEFGANNEKTKEECAGCGYPILLLTDKQALVVEGNKQEIVEVDVAL